MPGAWRAETFVAERVCEECRELYVAYTEHKRLFCTPECAQMSAQRKYRAKPETKAKLAEQARARRAKKRAPRVKDDFEPGTFGCHEAMQMARFLADTADMQLFEHPAIKRNKRWQRLAERAVNVLGDLYEAIGKAHL